MFSKSLFCIAALHLFSEAWGQDCVPAGFKFLKSYCLLIISRASQSWLICVDFPMDDFSLFTFTYLKVLHYFCFEMFSGFQFEILIYSKALIRNSHCTVCPVTFDLTLFIFLPYYCSFSPHPSSVRLHCVYIYYPMQTFNLFFLSEIVLTFLHCLSWVLSILTILSPNSFLG